MSKEVKGLPLELAGDVALSGRSLADVSWATVPSVYLSSRLGLRLYDWQAGIVDGLDGPGRVAFTSCNGAGKTSVVVAGLVIWHMETFRNSLTVTTAGVGRQVRDQLYPMLRKYGDRIGTVKIGDMRGHCPGSGSRLVSFTVDSPERAEGWHTDRDPLRLSPGGGNLLSEWGVGDAEWSGLVEHGKDTSLLVVIDEAKKVPDRVIDALVHRCRPTRILMCSSPGEPSGTFYDSFHREKGLWPLRWTIGAPMCPHLWDDPAARAEMEGLIGLRGRADSFVRSSIFGEFTSELEHGVFDARAIDAAMGGTLPSYGVGVKRAGLDLSGGGDEQALYVSDGNEATLVGSWHLRDDKRLVSEVVERLSKYRVEPSWCNADNGGLGAVILNEFDRRGKGLSRVDFSGKPRQPKFYRNRRTEMYFNLADRLKRGELRIPNDPELREQLMKHVYVQDDENRLSLIPKTQMFHGNTSPDRADALVLCFADFPGPEQCSGLKQVGSGHQRAPTVSEAWAAAVGGEELGAGLGWN